ncbi:MAG: NUDIX hydrolase [Oscillospiraceae bacterium]|jgi:ADP-ribose pyrophosphatase YjhB (NUDIX family)|nr:NUDIX hydrolase [Oscillospiraceae bacterium]
MSDLLFRTEEGVFSYRIAGILIHDGKILLQHVSNDPNYTGYSLPGGHPQFGETNEETLIREFNEEIGANIKVCDLKWVAELFFPWGEKPCHQICLYYEVKLANTDGIFLEKIFISKETLENQSFYLNFSWIPLEETTAMEIYPNNIAEMLNGLDNGVKKFIYRESS